jgi:hypothetical protein
MKICYSHFKTGGIALLGVQSKAQSSTELKVLSARVGFPSGLSSCPPVLLSLPSCALPPHWLSLWPLPHFAAQPNSSGSLSPKWQMWEVLFPFSLLPHFLRVTAPPPPSPQHRCPLPQSMQPTCFLCPWSDFLSILELGTQDR